MRESLKWYTTTCGIVLFAIWVWNGDRAMFVSALTSFAIAYVANIWKS